MPPDDPQRRATDPGGDRDIYTEITEIRKAQAAHKQQFDEHRREFTEHVNSHEGMDRQLEMVVDFLYGQPQIGPDGDVVRVGGAKTIIEQAENGGLKIHLPASVVSLLVALILTLGTIAAALIARTP